MKLRGRSAAQKRATDTGVDDVSPPRSGHSRAKAHCTVSSSQSWKNFSRAPSTVATDIAPSSRNLRCPRVYSRR